MFTGAQRGCRCRPCLKLPVYAANPMGKGYNLFTYALSCRLPRMMESLMLIKNSAVFRVLLVISLLPLKVAGALGQQSIQSATDDLKNTDKRARRQAASDLGVLGQREAVAPLEKAFVTEKDAGVRGEILLSLGKIRDRAGLPTLTRVLLTDSSKDVRLQAIDSILRLYIPIGDESALKRFFGGVKSLFAENEQLVVQPFVEVDKAAKEALAKALLDRKKEVRENAAKALGSLRATDQVGAMDQALSISSKDTRRAIVKSLGLIRSQDAGPALVRHLMDRDKEVVRQSAISLGMVKFDGARDELRTLFNSNRDKDLKRAAAEGLALIHHPGDQDFFMELVRSDFDDKLREFGAEGLARIADPVTEVFLRDRLAAETKSNVSTALHFALVSLGKNEFMPPLVEALTARFTNQAEIYLFEVGKHQNRIDWLYPYLNSGDPRIRSGIVRVLGRIGNYTAFDKVKTLSSDPDEGVARDAVQAMRILERSRP